MSGKDQLEEDGGPSVPGADGGPFWRTTPLAAMTPAQWESLCDGCGRCCLVKLEDEDSGAIAYTDVACRLFDRDSCRCADYGNRTAEVPDCVRLTPEAVATLGWLPPTCAYRLLQEGKDLPAWHPLLSGTPDSVRAAGISVFGKVAGLETEYGLFELVDHIVSWPVRWPRGAKGGGTRGGGTKGDGAKGDKAKGSKAKGSAAKPAGRRSAERKA